MKLNIIRGNLTERFHNLYKELSEQKIEDYEFWDGFYLPSVVESINAAHKQIVSYAKLAQWPSVTICEDDIKFTDPNSWNYYQSKIPEDYDIFLSMIFLGEIDENSVTKAFTGMTLYTVHERFYDTFLSVPKDQHIDRALAGLGRFVVCDPFVATQYDGWSGNSGRMETYGELTKYRKFYKS